MRLSKTLTTGAALVALMALTGCGGDSEDATGSSGKSLPKAKNVAEMERFVTQYTVCNDLETDATLGKYSETASEFEDLPKGAEAGVKERAYCKAERAQPIAMLTVSDMKKFLQALKTDEDAGALVGADFAVVPTDAGTTRALASAGMLVASCKADFNSKIPSGFIKRESGVDGCVLTDYFAS